MEPRQPPDLYWFNPCAEGYVARGLAFTPVKHQARLARDLANLPQFLCRKHDLVLVPELPSPDFLASIQSAGFDLPEFIPISRPGSHPLNSQRGEGRKLGCLRPWAWSPDSVAMLEPLFTGLTSETRSLAECYNPGIADLYSKAWSARFLREFLQNHPAEPWLCTDAELGRPAHSLEEALALIAGFRQAGFRRLVCKQAIGLAGHSALRLWEPELQENQGRWLSASFALSSQPSTLNCPMVIEPWLDRRVDFSVQLEMSANGLLLRGYTGLDNDLRGQFLGNWAGPDYSRSLPTQVLSLFSNPEHIVPHISPGRDAGGQSGSDPVQLAPPCVPTWFDRLHQCFESLFRSLEKELAARGFLGPLGIDAFVYRDAAGGTRLKPVVEINPRYTMGRLLVELMSHAAPGTYGQFRLIPRSRVGTQSPASPSEQSDPDSQAQADGRGAFHTVPNLDDPQLWPVTLEPGTRRIRQGAIYLNDPAQAQVVLAVFRVGPESASQVLV